MSGPPPPNHLGEPYSPASGLETPPFVSCDVVDMLSADAALVRTSEPETSAEIVRPLIILIVANAVPRLAEALVCRPSVRSRGELLMGLSSVAVT